MKCILQSGNKEDSNTVIVHRKFVPIHIKVERENQFINASAKLPFTSHRVLGVLPIPKVTFCTDTLLPPRYYFGFSEQQMVDTRFLADNPGKEYQGEYPPDLLTEFEPSRWWYFAHPVVDKLPEIIENGEPLDLGSPRNITIKQPIQCNGEPYYLWSSLLPDEGWVYITFSPPT